MCGRYAVTADPAALAAELNAVDETGPAPDPGPNYNVAPTTGVLAVVRRHDHDEPERIRNRIRRMRWGLIPPWTEAVEPGTPVKGKPLFNARADRAATSPAFRASLAHRRCLVPMDGWYEWQLSRNGARAAKTPYYLTPADGSRLYAAGLWSVWHDPRGRDQAGTVSCTILTTDAVGQLQQIHERMPLVLPSSLWSVWLDPDHPAPPRLLQSADAELVAGLERRPIGTAVNNIRNNGPELLRPADPTTPETLF